MAQCYGGSLGAGFSLERLCMPFNCAFFESLCMCGRIAWLLVFSCTPTHTIMFFCMFVSPVWLTTQNHSTLVTERSAVPFLPVNPEYSATRNQVKKNTHIYTLPPAVETIRQRAYPFKWEFSPFLYCMKKAKQWAHWCLKPLDGVCEFWKLKMGENLRGDVPGLWSSRLVGCNPSVLLSLFLPRSLCLWERSPTCPLT